MAKQSISLTEPNDEWLKLQVANNDYVSKSELVNDLVRQAGRPQRQVDWIATKLENSEKRGFTTDSKAEILAQSNAQLGGSL